MLVVIGLIIGGVLVGRDLIYVAKIRRAGGDIDKVKTSIVTFRLKYNCMPGDCATATNFFTLPANGGNWQLGNPNGNGNGLYDGVESYVRMWEHLQKAELWIEGIGSNSQTSNGVEMGVNVPVFSWYSGNYSTGLNDSAPSGWPMRGMAMYPIYNYLCPAGVSNCESFPTSFTGKNMLMLQGIVVQWPPVARALPDLGFSCGFAFDLDTKFDDGMPHTGSIQSVSFSAASQNCSNFDARSGVVPPTTNTYKRTNTYASAPMMVNLGL